MIIDECMVNVIIKTNTPNNPLTLSINYNKKLVWENQLDQLTTKINFSIDPLQPTELCFTLSGKNSSHTIGEDFEKHGAVRINKVLIDDIVLLDDTKINKKIYLDSSFKDVLSLNNECLIITLDQPFYYWVLSNLEMLKLK